MNYLTQAHLKLNQIVSAYLDLAANRAQRGIVMTMNDWSGFLNNFLELSNYPILTDKGKVSAHKAPNSKPRKHTKSSDKPKTSPTVPTSTRNSNESREALKIQPPSQEALTWHRRGLFQA
jgi:hypothetical protein